MLRRGGQVRDCWLLVGCEGLTGQGPRGAVGQGRGAAQAGGPVGGEAGPAGRGGGVGGE